MSGLFTFVHEYIMSIIGYATKDCISVFGESSVNSLCLHIEPGVKIHKTMLENILLLVLVLSTD